MAWLKINTLTNKQGKITYLTYINMDKVVSIDFDKKTSIASFVLEKGETRYAEVNETLLSEYLDGISCLRSL